MADATITKRLIISGLTPAITVDDVNRRLSSFGSVKAMDGFGLQDGLGQPRKFAFVTLETTPSRLGKCMSMLSGSVWKGAKLRLGEARPDYKERIAQENYDAVAEPPKKRRLFDAVHAEDMSLVTAENAAQRPGWTVSPLGRITRPLKIRPIRPLTQITRSKLHLKKSLARKGLDKVSIMDSRARRRTIDMTEWGSTHLKGSFLDSISLPMGKSADAEAKGDEGATSPALPIEPLPMQFDLECEKAQTLEFLGSLFGGSRNEEDDWIGTESVGSDAEVGELGKEDFSLSGNEPTFEEVPRKLDPLPSHSNPQIPVHQMDSKPSPKLQPAIPKTNVSLVKENKLKDLFAPREEVTFSLLDHLDLDIELDKDLSFHDEPMSTDLVASHQTLQIQSTSHMPHGQPSPRIVLNPKQALFFPLPPSESTEQNKARQRDTYDLIRENGWYWRDPAVRFWNTESEEEIRKRWEASRDELTKSWKQRWREAGKVRRRKKLVDGDENM